MTGGLGVGTDAGSLLCCLLEDEMTLDDGGCGAFVV
jgi:hypothetical protein